MVRGVWSVVACCCLAVCIVACGGNDANGIDGLSGAGGSFTVGSSACHLSVVDFESSGNWYCYVDYMNNSAKGWISTEPARGGAGKHCMTIRVDANSSEEEREAMVVVRSGSQKIEYHILQERWIADGDDDPYEPDPEIPGGDGMGDEKKLSLLKSVVVKQYSERHELINKSSIEFDYNASGFITVARWDDHEMRIDYSDGRVKYVVDGVAVADASVSSDGYIADIAGYGLTYNQNHRLSSFGNDMIAWKSGNINSISAGGTVWNFVVSDFGMTCNFHVDLLCFYGLEDFDIGKVPYFQSGLLGRKPANMVQFIKSENEKYGYNYLLDDRDRVIEVQEFRFVDKDGVANNYQQKEYRLNYLY